VAGPGVRIQGMEMSPEDPGNDDPALDPRSSRQPARAGSVERDIGAGVERLTLNPSTNGKPGTPKGGTESPVITGGRPPRDLWSPARPLSRSAAFWILVSLMVTFGVSSKCDHARRSGRQRLEKS
jgi:hypothetical protein